MGWLLGNLSWCNGYNQICILHFLAVDAWKSKTGCVLPPFIVFHFIIDLQRRGEMKGKGSFEVIDCEEVNIPPYTNCISVFSSF